jgi:hypothetical protein
MPLYTASALAKMQIVFHNSNPHNSAREAGKAARHATAHGDHTTMPGARFATRVTAGALTALLLLALRGDTSIQFLSAHPAGEERIDKLRQLMQSGN